MVHQEHAIKTLVPQPQHLRQATNTIEQLPNMVLALALWVVLAAGWIATRVFERVPHIEDEVAFLFQARTYAAGHLLAPAPSQPAFFWIPFVIVHNGHWFGKYPPGYALVLALGVLLHVPWLVNPLAAGLAIALTAKVGQRLFGTTAAILAALLLATSPFLLLQAGSFLSHVVCLDLTLCCILGFERFLRTGSPWSAAGSGLALAWLMLSRPLTAVAVAAPFVFWTLWQARQRGWRAGAIALGATGLVGLTALLGYNTVTTGHPLVFGYQLWWPFDRVGFGPGIGVRGEHTLQQGWQNTKENLSALSSWLFGWPGRLSLLPPGLGMLHVAARLLRGPRDRTTAWESALAGLVLSLILVHLAYWASGQMYGPRYYFEGLGALTLLSARGTLALAGLGNRLLSSPRRRIQARLAGICVLGGLMTWNLLVFTPQQFHTYTGWYGVTSAGIQAVRTAGIHHAIVFVVAPRWTDYAPFFVENSPWLDNDIIYALDHGSANSILLAQYPNRSAYRWQNGQLFLIRLAVDTPSPTPASQPRDQQAGLDQREPSHGSTAGRHAAHAVD